MALIPALNHHTPCLLWMPANKVTLDRWYFAARNRDNIRILVLPVRMWFPPSRRSRQWCHPITAPLLVHTELWCELEKGTPSSICQKIVIIYFLLEQITLLPDFIMKSVIISPHIYDICDANGALRVVQCTTWATIHSSLTLRPQPSQNKCSLDSVSAKPECSKAETLGEWSLASHLM